jgi:hypothetical protein
MAKGLRWTPLLSGKEEEKGKGVGRGELRGEILICDNREKKYYQGKLKGRWSFLIIPLKLL